MRAWVLLLACSLLFALAGRSAAHPLDVVPARHWAYAALRQAALAGLVPFNRLASEPLTRGEIAALVRASLEAAPAARPPSGITDLLEALAAEFLGDDPRERVGLRAEAGGGELSVGVGRGWDRWWLAAEGGRAWGVDAGAFLRRGYVSGRTGTVGAALGRELLWWGQSPRSTLFLDTSIVGLDALRLSAEWPGLRLTKVVSPLSLETGRYLIATRADWQATPRLRIGLVELVLAQPGPLFGYWIVNPLPVVVNGPLGALLQSWTGTDDNLLGGAEFDYIVRPGVLLYGQGLVDDVSTRGNAPHRIGGQAGLLLADPFRSGRTTLRLEYTAVTNWTYTSMTSRRDHFLHNGRPLGFWLGNDGDDLYLELDHVLSASGTLTGWLARTRRGEGRVGTPWPSEAEAFGAWWLSGVVETRHAMGVRFETRRAGGGSRVWAEVGALTNRGNVSGAFGWDYRLGFELSRSW